jgi:hypothetical protein
MFSNDIVYVSRNPTYSLTVYHEKHASRYAIARADLSSIGNSWQKYFWITSESAIEFALVADFMIKL